MRKVASIVAVLLLAGLTLAAADMAKGKTHDVTAVVAAVDIEASTITIKGEKGEDKVLPVAAGAAEDLKKVKAGDKVILTCMDNEKSEHQAITAIKPAKA